MYTYNLFVCQYIQVYMNFSIDLGVFVIIDYLLFLVKAYSDLN
jgi:hypothetical protein